MTEDDRALGNDNRAWGNDDRPEPPGQQPAQGAGDEYSDAGQDQSPTGRMRFQDPDSTTPREPTLAEKRARERAEQRQHEEHKAKLAEAERKSKSRRRVLLGGGVTVGVVALVASFYSAATYTQNRDAVTQYCALEQGGQTIAENDQNCDPNHVNSSGGQVSPGGFFLMPMPGGGMGQYRYGYTQPGKPAPTAGSPVTSPNFTKPGDANIKSKSGASVQRGGFGLSGKSGGS